jgi:hypothetical protein
MVVYGTTVDAMIPFYSRPHRSSIDEPATIHDFPFEVLENCLKYLNPADLVAPSLACRAWRPAATGLIYHLADLVGKDPKGMERFICGLHLRNIVFGSGSCKIKRLDLDLSVFAGEYVPLIARLVAPTLSFLKIDFFVYYESSLCFEILDIFINSCSRIQSLWLEGFDFGDDPVSITPTTKDWFSRLKHLVLFLCGGNVSMFVDNTPIPNLQFLRYLSIVDSEESGEILQAFAKNFNSLSRLQLDLNLDSSASLLHIVECNRGLKFLEFSCKTGILRLNRPDIEAIASLPRLNSLRMGGCKIYGDVLPYLAGCRVLKEFDIFIEFSGVHLILSEIGGGIKHLGLRFMDAESVAGVLKFCPNLHRLFFVKSVDDVDARACLDWALKDGLKKLASFQVGGDVVRLGTDWIGY